VGFKINDRRVPRQHYSIHSTDGKAIGEVTSGTVSPTLGYPIGMGYVTLPFAKAGTRIQIKAGEKMLDAEITDLPFV
jgi:aminomethyltransferase